MVRQNDSNDEIMQRRVEEDKRRDPALHVREPGEVEASLEARGGVPAGDRRVGHTRTTRAPYPGEVVGNKTPPFEVVGVDALSPILMHVEFPASREDIVEAIGEARIPVSRNRARSVREIMGFLTPDSFASNREVEESLKRVWDQVADNADLSDRGGRQRQDDRTERRGTN